MAVKKRKTKLVAEKKLFRKKRRVTKPAFKGRRTPAQKKATAKLVAFNKSKKKRNKNPVKKTIMGTPKMNYRIYQIVNGVDTFACGCANKDTAKQIAHILNAHASGKAHFVVIDYA